MLKTYLRSAFWSHFRINSVVRASISLMPITDIHLHSKVISELNPQGSPATMRLLTIIALFILLIACVNFINLSAARLARGSRLRSALVVGRLSIASGLVFATVVVFNQLNYMQNMDPGHAIEDVIVMPGIYSMAEDFEPFRERLLSNPDIIDVTHAFRPPLQPLVVAADATADVESRQERIQIFPMWADEHYVRTHGLDIVAGRNFNPEIGTDKDSRFLLNETAVSRFGFLTNELAVGAAITFVGREGTILGVVKDYH